MMDMNVFDTPSFWDNIGNEKRPIVIYGTGDAADKLSSLLAARGRHISAVFASDAFVRSRTWQGRKVLSFQRVKEIYGCDMVVLCAFGSHKRSVIDEIVRISNECDFYLPDLLLDDEGKPFILRTAEREREKIRWAYSLLEDEKSRRVFRNNIIYRLSGRIQPLLEDMDSRVDNWSILSIGEGDTFFDCGAYDGDTVRLFRSLGGKGVCHAAEPGARAFRKLSQYVDDYDRNTYAYNVVLGREDGVSSFSDGSGRGNAVGGERHMEMRSVDSILEGSSVSVLKMDTEGEEENVMAGAERTIRKSGTKVVLSAYHRWDDYWRLPERMLSVRDDFSVYMRRTVSLPAWDTEFFFL